MRGFSPLGLRERRVKDETQNEEVLWPNMCTPPEFLVHLCPPVYCDVTLCPASSGDAGDMWCFDRLERVPRKIDSPRLQSTESRNSGSLHLILHLLCWFQARKRRFERSQDGKKTQQDQR